MSNLIGNVKPDEQSISLMRKDNGEWYAYQNMDMSHSGLGHLQFLKCGSGATILKPPKRMPDTHFGIGWRYQLVGKVNLESGEIEEVKQ